MRSRQAQAGRGRELVGYRSDDGYAPIRDYAAIGDGRTIALVARDGSIDWLCLPDMDSPSVFGAMLDPERGGHFSLSPEERFEVARRYVPGTNVLETIFSTASGRVRVTDAMVLPLAGLGPTRELVRRIETLSGSIRLRWSVEPRFGYARVRTRFGRRLGLAIAAAGREALGVQSFEAGDPSIDGGAIRGSFVCGPGASATLALSVAHGDPLVFSSRAQIEERLSATVDFWQGWSASRHYAGPWRDAVLRSALVLKLLIHSPSGAIAAAATTSLPEVLGGVRNWDYRYSWIRDSSATLDALLRLGCPHEGEAFFWWLLHASQLTHPHLNVLYRLSGQPDAPEQALELRGYRDSRPVVIGNAAAPQRQLDVYGHLLQTAWLYADSGGRLSGDAAARLAATADLVTSIWREKDSGIWEVRSEPVHFTESKMMCWIALDRAARLAESGHISAKHLARWRLEADEVRRFVAEYSWSPERQSYLRFPGAEGTDAGLLLPALLGYGLDEDRERLLSTIRLIRAELGEGPLVYRYRGEDGLPGQEGAFLACSFWLVEALARLGEITEASELMGELIPLANDVGLYAEEIDPESGEFLGNFPQALVHLGLIGAAVTLAELDQ